MAVREELEALLAEAGLRGDWIAPLAQFGELVLDANRHVNLTGAKSAAEIAGHILDSLTVLPFLEAPYVDVGSGAGFPALVVAIAGGPPPTMIEATAKKARFLDSALRTFALEGRVVAERAEVAAHAPDLRERFAVATARALGTAPTVAELVVPLLAPGGAAILQRGAMPAEERRALDDAALMLGAKAEAEHELGENRRILVIRKVAPTAGRFPRRAGVPAKRPLCTGR